LRRRYFAGKPEGFPGEFSVLPLPHFFDFRVRIPSGGDAFDGDFLLLIQTEEIYCLNMLIPLLTPRLDQISLLLSIHQMTHDLRDRERENRERTERKRGDYLLLGSRSLSRWPWRWATA
jgi:hypothetical protein